jgi:hypothetical protein
MKYVKTFETFSYDAESELNEGLISWLKDVYGKVTEWFTKWRDKKAKEAAAKLAMAIEQKGNEPKVKAQAKKISEAYKKLSPEEKKEFNDTISTESKVNELGKALEKSGAEKLIKECIEQIENGTLNESMLFENRAIIGEVVKVLGVVAAVATIIYMCVVFCTLVGAGYVAAWAIGAGMAAGHFAAVGCAVIAACGIVSGVGEGIKG